MAGPTKKLENSSKLRHACQYCSATFAKETTLATHNCEPKRRIAQQNEVGVRLGFRCFQKFFNYIKPSDAEKTYLEFVDSPYYLAFVKFGRYCVEIRAISPEAFCDWLIKGNRKLDQWTRDSYYDEFLLDYLQRELSASALERSIETMTVWAEENNARFQDYFKYASESRICFDIQRGRISPWIIYTSQTGQDFLNKLNEKDLAHIWRYIDSDFWIKNFDRCKIDFDWTKEIVDRAGL